MTKMTRMKALRTIHYGGNINAGEIFGVRRDDIVEGMIKKGLAVPYQEDEEAKKVIPSPPSNKEKEPANKEMRPARRRGSPYVTKRMKNAANS